IFGKRVPEGYRAILRYAVTYSNCGFMGLPLLKVLVGSSGVFYGTAYLAVFNLFIWTHGVLIFQSGQASKENRRLVLKALINPNVCAIAVGILFFFCSVQLPAQIFTPLNDIALVNAPLSLIAIGVMISQRNLSGIWREKYLWPVVALRNLLIPLAAVAALRLLGLHGAMLYACLIQVACPIAGNTALFAEMFGKDTVLPSKLIAVSTLLSIITIPFVLWAAG
ncbi:MAG: AEC family transporter, partial [Clostridia bacterium]|nr:AEC family transporter [Clostridia bacterium]